MKVTCNRGVFYYTTLKNVVEALKTTRSTVLKSIREEKLCLGEYAIEYVEEVPENCSINEEIVVTPKKRTKYVKVTFENIDFYFTSVKEVEKSLETSRGMIIECTKSSRKFRRKYQIEYVDTIPENALININLTKKSNKSSTTGSQIVG